MKKWCFVLVTSIAVAVAIYVDRIYAGDEGGIPLSTLAGKYAVTFPLGGFFTECFKPDFSATESCSTPGAVPLNISGATVGQSTQDRDGDSCAQFTGAFAVISGQTMPPSVLSFFGVSKVTNYDPATGSGDSSFTNYVGGKCIGAKFDSTGATVNSTGTNHFVASDDGERVDSTTLTFSDALGNIGGFNIISLALKQEK